MKLSKHKKSFTLALALAMLLVATTMGVASPANAEAGKRLCYSEKNGTAYKVHKPGANLPIVVLQCAQALSDPDIKINTCEGYAKTYFNDPVDICEEIGLYTPYTLAEMEDRYEARWG